MGGRRGRPFGDPGRDVDEELRYHLERRADELVAGGMDPAEARRAARAEFGDLDGTRAYCIAEDRAAARRARRGAGLRTLADEVRGALRQLRRHPGSVAAPGLVLAAGITLNVLVFTVVEGVLLAPLGVADEADAYVLEEVQEGGGLVRAAYPVLAAWKEGATSFGHLAGYLDSPYPLVTRGAPVHVAGAAVTHGFFDLLDDPFLAGGPFSREQHTPRGAPAAILSEGLWRRAFGASPDVLGGTVRLAGTDHRVSGIVRQGAGFPDGTELWVPLESTYPDLTTIAGAKIVVALGTLRPGASEAGATEELAALSRGVDGGAPGARLTPLRDRLLGGVDSSLLLLQGSVLLLLLAACVNAGAMLLTRAVRRQGELAVRISLGAGPGRVAAGLVAEGVLLGLVAGAVGLGLAALLLGPVVRLAPPDLPRLDGLALDPGVATLALLLAAATGLLTAVAPLWTAVRLRPAVLIRDHAGRAGTSRWMRRLQEGFVVGQVALATVLTAGALLLGRSFLETVTEDPGFDPARITVVEVALPEVRYPDPASRLDFTRRMLDQAAGLPGAQAVAVGRNLPISGSNMTSPLALEGSGTTDAVQIAAVSAGYFEVMGIPIVDGTGFGGLDREDGPATLIIDATLRGDGSTLDVGSRARSFFGSSPPRDVVGVAGAVRHGGLREAPEPIAYEPFFQRGGAESFSLLVRSDAPAAVVAQAARDLMGRLDPELPADRVGTMAGRLRTSVAEPRFYTLGLGTFAALAVLLALAGCQAGLARQVAGQRRELGLRVALGASSGGIRGRIVRRGLTLTGAGILLGVAAALPASGLLRSQLYGVRATDPLTYLMLAAALLVAAALAADVPARRATRVDPAEVLREE